MQYSQKVLDHFMHPHNVGKMENPDAVATEGSPACGDQVTVYLKVDDQTKTITDISFLSYGCASNIAYLRELSNYLLEKIEKEISDVELNGPRGEKRAPHNINVSIDFIEGEAITMMLDQKGITVATGSACASEGLKANYVLMAMGKTHIQSHGSMKFTVSRYTTKAELDETVQALTEITKELRKRSPLYLARTKEK